MNTQKTSHHARRMRKNPTAAEQCLWRRLNRRQIFGLKFRRQAPIGKYIVDFVCFEEKFVVELDGGQHKKQVSYDQERTDWLESQGYRVLRFWNNDVLQNIEGVMAVIGRWVGENHPHPGPPPSRGREKKR